MNFPSSPTTGQEYSFGSRTWRYNGKGWQLLSALPEIHYNDISGKPALADVATSGSYNDLSDKPTIPTLPTLAPVATSGDYNDLSNKPSIPTIPGVATTSTNGLMSSTDKTKLNAVGTMANRNATISTADPSGGTNGDVWFKV